MESMFADYFLLLPYMNDSPCFFFSLKTTTHTTHVCSMQPLTSTGTFLWIYTADDKEWWPAVVVPPPMEFSEIIGGDGDFDACVKMFHNANEIYPICTKDADAVAVLEWTKKECDARFQNPRVHRALMRAEAEMSPSMPRIPPPPSVSTREQSQHRHSNDERDAKRLISGKRDREAPRHLAAIQPAPPVPPQATTRRQHETYTEEEIIKMRRLLGALDETETKLLRESLGLDAASERGFAPLSKEERRQQRKERRALRAARQEEEEDHEATLPTAQANASESTRSSLTRSLPQAVLAQRERTAITNPPNQVVEGGESSSSVEEILDDAALEVVRMEVFENRDLLVFDPIFRYVNTLGAVAAPNHSFEATLPTRSFFYTNHRACDRVLLVPLGPGYQIDAGWMEPLQWEGDVTLELKLYVNHQPLKLPQNWRIPASKQDQAQRTLIPIDITDVIECTLPEEEGFQLRIEFSPCDVPDVVLWDVVVACVLVEQISLLQVCEGIRGNVQSMQHQRPKVRSGGIRCEAQQLGVRCPLTSMLLETPCRGIRCEHNQCMELTAVVEHCTRQHLWNCPLCGVRMHPNEIIVDYTLMSALKNAEKSKQRFGELEGMVLSERTGSYEPKWKVRTLSSTTIVDSDDDE